MTRNDHRAPWALRNSQLPLSGAFEDGAATGRQIIFSGQAGVSLIYLPIIRR